MIRAQPPSPRSRPLRSRGVSARTRRCRRPSTYCRRGRSPRHGRSVRPHLQRRRSRQWSQYRVRVTSSGLGEKPARIDRPAVLTDRPLRVNHKLFGRDISHT